jgi:hypothetical protein
MMRLIGANLIRQPDGRWRVERHVGWGTLVTFHDSLLAAWIAGSMPL